MTQEKIMVMKLIAPFGCIGVLYFFCRFLTKDNKSSFYWNMILFCAMMYPLCKVLQVYLIGPRFFRHHLTDFGFVPMFALTLYSCSLFNRFSFDRLLGISVKFSVLWELNQIVLFKPTNVNFVAAGDYIDIFMFITSYYICKIFYEIYNGEIKVAS